MTKPTSDKWWRTKEIHGCETWEDGELLFEFAKAHGLVPSHYMLEVGCGALRAGRFFIDYLEPGHYFGLDHNEHVLSAAREEIVLQGLVDKKATLFQSTDFDLSLLPEGIRFDFAWSHSVMTHMTPSQVEACLGAVFGRMAENGVYFSTYNESLNGEHTTSGMHPWRDGELNGARFPAGFFVSLARKLGLAVEFVCSTYLKAYTRQPIDKAGLQFVVRFRKQSREAMETGF
jgi:SAM-dependent methyltransferase